MTPTSDLGQRVRDAAYLEGDFVLRSGRRSSFYLDKYRFATDPAILRDLGREIAAAIARAAPAATRIAAPELGAVALAAAASMDSGLPFVIVRKEAKSYGTAQRIEGVVVPGETVVVVEDVITSGGAAIDSIEALRAAGLACEHVVCVIDREEGGAEALAAIGVALTPVLRRSDIGI